MHSLNDIVILVGTGFIILSVIVALYYRKKVTFSYLKNFYIITFITFIISINAICGFLLGLYSKQIYISIQNIFFIIDLIFWGFFFLGLLKLNQKYVRVVFIFFLFFVIALRLYTGINTSYFQIHSISNFCKLIFCVFYFDELFKSNLRLNLKTDPGFWIVTGVFFYTAISFPVYAIHNYLRDTFGEVIAGNIFAVTNITIIIMHLLFIKAYICSSQQRKIS